MLQSSSSDARKHKRGKKIELNFARPRKRRAETPSTADERQRAVEEFIRRHGVTKCPAGYSHMDW